MQSWPKALVVTPILHYQARYITPIMSVYMTVLLQASERFIIKHYAGDVQYDVNGFVDKNKDLLFNDLIDLANCTNSSIIPQLFPELGQDSTYLAKYGYVYCTDIMCRRQEKTYHSRI